MSKECACARDAIILLDRLEIFQKEIISEEPVVPFTKKDFDFLRVAINAVQDFCNADLKQISDNIDLAENYWNKGEKEAASGELWKSRFGIKTEILKCSHNPFFMRQKRRIEMLEEEKKKKGD